MEIWNALKKPPQSALKTIQGGRLRGFTDVNPQWRYKAMTEHFGVCGIGWRYTIEKLWLEPAEEEICAFAEVALSVKIKNEWSAPIPGIGGSMLLAQETAGPHVSDEAYKMAITDALSVAMKMIGMAADVYEGFFDGTKYTGIEATPAKEMADETPKGHWCAEHQATFFKKGKMRNWAHKIVGTDDWCNESVSEPSIEVVATEGKDSDEILLELSSQLLANLKIINWKEATTISFMVNAYKISKEGGLVECINRLSPEQLSEFCTQVQEMVNKRGKED